MNHYASAADAVKPPKAQWGAVYSLSLGVFGLIVAEFLPASLLTPMAAGLNISEGMAGQAVTATAIVALVSGLFITAVTGQMDRRKVLLWFSVLQIVSSVVVAFAPSFSIMLAGRLVLGVAIGGFWAMSTATTMRLVPADKVPKALGTIFAGVSIGTIVTAPLGSYLGDIIGWRYVYLLGAAPCLIAFIWQLSALPAMKPAKAASIGTLFTVLRRPGIAYGKLAIILIWAGHFALFTYIRPFLENVSGFSVGNIAIVLLVFGLANITGNTVAGYFISRKLKPSLAIPPLLMGVSGLLLVAAGQSGIITTLLIVLWGFSFAIVSVGWPSWLSVTVPDEAESAGGLFIAAMQLAISTGAAGGGLIFDYSGVYGVFIAGGIALILASSIVALRVNTHAEKNNSGLRRIN